MELDVRDATPDDAEAVIGILNPINAARVYTALDTPFSVDAEREYIRSLSPRAVLHLALRRADRR